MNFYKHHIGDYDQATKHLSLIEDAIYRRLLCKCYADELPLPADIATVERLIGTKTSTEREALQSVLDEFFTREPDGWHNKRCDEEIAAASAKGDERAAKAANVRARQRRHREERKAMFAELRGLGIVAPWDATTEALRAMLNAQPVTRDRAADHPPVTRDRPTGHATGHAPVTAGSVTGPEFQRDRSATFTREATTGHAPVTRTATAIPDSKTPRLNSAAPSSNTAPLAPQGAPPPGPLPGSVSTLDPDAAHRSSLAGPRTLRTSFPQDVLKDNTHDTTPRRNAPIDDQASTVVKTNKGGGPKNAARARKKKKSVAAKKKTTTTTLRGNGKSSRSRIPADWQPDEAARAYAVSVKLRGDVLDAEIENFRSRWRAAKGAKALKASWTPAWRAWCMNAVTRRRIKFPPIPSKPVRRP